MDSLDIAEGIYLGGLAVIVVFESKGLMRQILLFTGALAFVVSVLVKLWQV